MECCDAGLSFWIVGSGVHENANASHALCLLRTRRERQRDRRRAAEQCDELAPSHHSITSSAVICMINGTVRPNALAALRLITSSNLVGSMTGRSSGLAPLRTRPT